MEYFLTVGQQVLVLFILIGAGFILGKRGIMGERGAKACSDIALLLATPCVIINSFRRDVTTEMLWGLLAALGVSVLIHGIGIGVGHLFFRQSTPRDRVLRLATVLSNAGFMGLPLQQAVLGETGVFYGATYVAIFNVTLWSYGQLSMNQKAERVSWTKVLLNPGTIGLALGIVVLLLPVELPEVIAAPISHLAALNTPLPMLFIGYCLSKVDFKQALRRPVYFGASAVRLLVVPLVTGIVLYLLGIRGTLFVSMMIAASAPIAAAVPMFATRYEQDSETAANLVALSTVFSLATMPILVSLAQVVAG